MSTWCRARAGDLDAAAQTQVDTVHLSFPVSDIHLRVWRKNRAWVLDTLGELLPAAQRRFTRVTVGAQDASRADVAFLREFAAAARALGATRLRVADTVGTLHPLRTARLIRELRRAEPVLQLDFHGHNDLGMATANTVAALLAGADTASVTVNGLGERAGNAAAMPRAFVSTNSRGSTAVAATPQRSSRSICRCSSTAKLGRMPPRWRGNSRSARARSPSTNPL